METFIVIILIILVIILCIVIAINRIINKIKRSGISQIVDMVVDADKQYDTKPKSLSGGDSLYLPRILRDYPDFDLEKAKADIERSIALIFNDISQLEGNASVSAQKLASRYAGETSSLRFHNTAISNYIKSSESATIKLQTAFELKINGKLKQERYETEYTLFFKNEANHEVLTFSCENCGAPLTSLNAKTCEYCGNGLSFMQERMWVINSIILK